jgi:hypothetical protein
MSNPRDPYVDPLEPRTDDLRRPARGSRTSTSAWGWIVGIVAVIFIVAIVYGVSRDNSSIANNGSPTVTTGSAPLSPPPPSTTGQGGGASAR